MDEPVIIAHRDTCPVAHPEYGYLEFRDRLPCNCDFMTRMVAFFDSTSRQERGFESQ